MRVPWILLLFTLGGALAPAPAHADKPLTSYEAGPLRDANLVVVGTPRPDRSARPGAILQVDVERVLLGTVPSDPLNVIARGPQATRSVSRRRSPFPSTGRHVFFLGLGRDALAATFRDAFRAEGTEGEQKVAALAREIELARIADPQVRTRQTREWLLTCLAAKGTWTRAHGVRELLRFAAARPAWMDGTTRARIQTAASRAQPRAVRTLLVRLETWMRTHPVGRAPEHVPSALPGATPGVPEEEAWRSRFATTPGRERAGLIPGILGAATRRQVERARWCLHRGDAAVHLAVLRHLKVHGDRRALPLVRDAYGLSSNAQVRQEAILAYGALGDDRELPWLVERLRNARVRRQALLAMAGVGTKAARYLLVDEARRLAPSKDPAVQRERAWILHLLERAPREASTRDSG